MAQLAPTASAQDTPIDPVGAVNAVRRQECRLATPAAPFVHVPQLDSAAGRAAAGEALGDAVKAAGYRSAHSALIRIDGVRSQAGLRRALAQSCGQITQPGLGEAGAFAKGHGVWIVLAEPFRVPALEKTAVARSILELVNAARARSRRCGLREYGAVRPVRWSSNLERAALGHAHDMAERAAIDHVGRDGSTPSQRVARTGYAWAAVAENVAAGQRDANSVVNSWLRSPGHCANLMGAEFTEMGVAFATNPSSEAGIFWAQVLAAPLANGSAAARRGGMR